MKLTDLCEEFISQAERPMSFGSLPVSPKQAEAPILPTNRWETDDGQLVKTFKFRRPEDREIFVMELFAYEKEVGHHSTMTVTQDDVTLRLYTHDTGKVSELDKEYSKYADQLYKDVSYAPETVYSSERYDSHGKPLKIDDV